MDGGTRHGAHCGKCPRSLSEVSGHGARPGVYPRGTKAQAPPNLRAIITAPFTGTAEIWKELKCPSACEQINKPWYVLSFAMKRKHVVSTGQSRDEAQVCAASERSRRDGSVRRDASRMTSWERQDRGDRKHP